MGRQSAWERPKRALETPSKPAAGSVCPVPDLPAVNTKGDRADVQEAPNTTALKAPTSMGSPKEVPVPCICTMSSSCGGRPAKRRALRTASCWDGPFGAVKELLRPSWFTEVARNAANPSMPPREEELDQTNRETQASPRTYPLAAASKVLHRPSNANMPALWNIDVVSGAKVKFTPAARASSQAPRRMLENDTWVATKEEEQAVSTLKAGPFQPYV
mmetsp:Transcript_10407/g.63538  ORF Transcript_10407/g.63538 Transcript_10407/m.63538 type:complete len:217 (+) Transcript_10407:12122-12772(+)